MVACEPVVFSVVLHYIMCNPCKLQNTYLNGGFLYCNERSFDLRWDAELNYRIHELPRMYSKKNQVVQKETMRGKHAVVSLSVPVCVRTRWALRVFDETGLVAMVM